MSGGSRTWFLLVCLICVLLVVYYNNWGRSWYSSLLGANVASFFIFRTRSNNASDGRLVLLPSRNQSNCSPISVAKQAYSVRIDGVLYPKRVPLFLNQSLDFACLNSSDKLKTILLWTPFFGESCICLYASFLRILSQRNILKT